MMRYLLLSATLAACASTPQPACPKCYDIDDVVPYEPPQRMLILCDYPDAGRADDEPDAAPVEDETGPIRF